MDNPSARSELIEDIWAKLFRLALRVLGFGGLLVATAYLVFGREFRNDELGILLWPLTGLYLISSFYVLTFLVFTSVKSPLRYLVIPLWFLMMLLISICLLMAPFMKKRRVEPAVGANPDPAVYVVCEL